MKKLMTLMALVVGILAIAPTNAEAGYRYVKERQFAGYARCGSPIYHWVSRRIYVPDRSYQRSYQRSGGSCGYNSRGYNSGGYGYRSSSRGGYYRGY